MRLGWTATVGLYAALLAFGGSAFAQPSDADTAAARALFSEGRALADSQRWPEAADRFRRALALRPSPAIRYNLAVALDQLGQLVEASEQLRTAIREAPAPDRTRTAAEALLRNVEPRIGRLTIVLEGDADGVDVLLDGRPLSSALLGVGAPADPGHHRVVARRGTAETSEETDLEPGAAASITIEAPAAGASGPLVEPGPDTTPDDSAPPASVVVPAESEGPSTGPNWALVAIGGVAIAGGVALDVAPSSASNRKFDALDVVPVGLYLAGAALVALGVF